ncbi:hypothetical protein BDN70DRAFT_802741 [Pholiota conissans]|uniref:Uncharacterized protein n=1 Tax=Pholiota conissans TaxID=109636 RepID=A0A9P6CWD5_9AGAR|nr:hypothetical protein BDN70DRAFT_802741 [Pholiota conissans]
MPNEIVEQIIQQILETDEGTRSDETGENSKPSWKLLEAFSCTCWNFRLLALPVWFRTLYLKSASDIQDIQTLFPVLKEKWTRHLHCICFHDSQHLVWDLSGFKRLYTIRVDWLYQNFTPLYAMEDPEVVPFINVDSPIKELDIRGVRYPSPMILQAFTNPLQHLVILKLESLRTWCGLCHTCTLVRFPSPKPAGFLYEGGLGLSVHYARSLFSLNYLEEVIFTLPDVGFGLPSPDFPSDSDENNMWTGECDRCIALMYDDSTFRKGWMARKRGVDVEGVHPRSIYQKPPSLKKVQWNFWMWDLTHDTKTYSQEELNVDDEAFFDVISVQNSEDEAGDAEE